MFDLIADQSGSYEGFESGRSSYGLDCQRDTSKHGVQADEDGLVIGKHR